MTQSPGAQAAPTTGAAVTNLRTIGEIERQSQRNRSRVQVLTDHITATASSFPFIVVHVVWFAVWIGLNTLSSYRFDAFPFNLLTMVVSLEAILLTAFVLMSQNHLTLLADRRAHLDLQVNLLAERELTAILKAVCLISDKIGVDINQCDANLDELLGRTDVKRLSEQVTKELTDPGTGPIGSAEAPH
jgi:uncharacterized membrane protein